MPVPLIAWAVVAGGAAVTTYVVRRMSKDEDFAQRVRKIRNAAGEAAGQVAGELAGSAVAVFEAAELLRMEEQVAMQHIDRMAAKAEDEEWRRFTTSLETWTANPDVSEETRALAGRLRMYAGRVR
ncbi:hypothetical protein GCM10007079_01400 [Nocardiopsis terrae]|uniref:Uncharacterized protein n=1 Tax=Nocardiopsis terrae TaxID=372655 RepID=A0ABR9HMD5_9ACTN|nr:hypothetical protein [Nocardiopsis terrae]MBE1460192.1 hypothetical protein [Nocardiopsis terrae]GHC70175.1 hypothetical protein GCM10007079_01400 [Nocardiopsis terrae]